MTREEVYSRIDAIIAKYEIDDEYVTIANPKDYEALRIARKFLEQEPETEHWIEYKPDHHRCSNCKKDALVKWNTAKKDNVDILTDYCPNCGSKMESEG